MTRQSADSVDSCDYSFSEKNNKRLESLLRDTELRDRTTHEGFYVLQNYMERDGINFGRVQMALQLRKTERGT